MTEELLTLFIAPLWVSALILLMESVIARRSEMRKALRRYEVAGQAILMHYLGPLGVLTDDRLDTWWTSSPELASVRAAHAAALMDLRVLGVVASGRYRAKIGAVEQAIHAVQQETAACLQNWRERGSLEYPIPSIAVLERMHGELVALGRRPPILTWMAG